MLQITTKTAFRFLIPFSIFTSILCSNSVDASNYIMHRCDDTSNKYVSFSPFQLALNITLFSVFPADASQAKFSKFTNGTGVDQVNALYYCREDLSQNACRDCVMAAADKIAAKCEFMKEAVVWHEERTLRYSNRNIFFIDEESPFYIYTNSTGIINEELLNPFTGQFDTAVDKLINQAAYTTGLQGFATEKVDISSTEVLYCVMQCSPDILGGSCETCLRSALKERDKWSDTMIFMPSCFSRVDLYGSKTLLANASPPPAKKWVKVVIISVTAAIIVIVATLVSVIYYIRKHPVIKGFEGLRVFTHAELSAATGGFSGANILGKGAFGEVFKGVIPRDNLAVAVKKLKIGVYNGEKEFISEMESNSLAKHVNVVMLIGYCSEGKNKLLVYEFMPRNCLHKNLHGKVTGKEAKPEELVPEIRMKIALGTARGLKYLHEDCAPKIIHRDVKSANILLDSNFEAKVADFGVAKIFPDDVSHVSTSVQGTTNYLDPDYKQSKKLTEKSDVYSFGIVLLELITGWTSTRLNESGKTTRLLQAITECSFSDLIDPILKNNDGQMDSNDELLMIRMMICAALCLHPLPICRLKMSQVVKLLESGRLDVNDVAGIVAYARNDTERSKAPTAHPATFKLENLRKLAVQAYEKVNRTPQRDNLASQLSYEMSNPMISFRLMDTSTYMDEQDLYE